MNITIRDLVKVVKWEEVERAIRYFYPTDKNRYKSVFEYLQKVRKRKASDEKLQIKVYGWLVDEPLGEAVDNRGYAIATDKYSLSFRKWSELANLPISQDTLDHYMFEEIVAHFIWEITFYGNETQAKETKKEIMGRLKEFKQSVNHQK